MWKKSTSFKSSKIIFCLRPLGKEHSRNTCSSLVQFSEIIYVGKLKFRLNKMLNITGWSHGQHLGECHFALYQKLPKNKLVSPVWRIVPHYWHFEWCKIWIRNVFAINRFSASILHRHFIFNGLFLRPETHLDTAISKSSIETTFEWS